MLVTSGAFGDGFNLVSWLCFGSQNISTVFTVDETGGCQLTGGFPAPNSDQVKYFDAATLALYTTWYKAGGPGPTNIWYNTLPTIESDKSYWIIIKSFHPSVNLDMWSDIPGPAVTPRTIPIQPGMSFSYVGNALCLCCYLWGPYGDPNPPGDGVHLLASGFIGGATQTLSFV